MAFNLNQRLPSQDLPKQNVKLKPIAGIMPGIYLTIIYVFMISTVLFLVAVFPGIQFYGTSLTFISEPRGATIHVDGRFLGTTPMTAKIPAGKLLINVSKEFFYQEEATIKIDGKRILSWPFPLRKTHQVSLRLKDPSNRAQQALIDFSQNPKISSIITRAAEDLSSPVTSTEQREAFLKNALELVEDMAGLAALTTAYLELNNNHGPISGSNLKQIFQEIGQLANDYPNFPLWLSTLIPSEAAAKLTDGPWYNQTIDQQFQAFDEPPPLPSIDPHIIRLAGMIFHRIPTQAFVMGDVQRLIGASKSSYPYEEWPHVLTPELFYMQQNEVTKDVFSDFVDANPEWAPKNRTNLIERGLITEDYLSDWVDDQPPLNLNQEPVVYVSAFAAEAFATWITEQFPEFDNGRKWTARLPFEPEWEYAAQRGTENSNQNESQQPLGHLSAPNQGIVPVGYSTANLFGLQDMFGNVWEWTSDWYSPTRYLLARDFIADYIKHKNLLVGTKRVVRGGSFASARHAIRSYTRGSQPATWCTPTLGFRLVLVENNVAS